MHIYMNRKRDERVFLDSSRPALFFNTSFSISVFLRYAYLFYFMCTIILHVLPKSYPCFIYRIKVKYIHFFLTMSVWDVNLQLK